MQYCTRVLFSAEFAKEVRLFGLGDFFLDRYRETFQRAHAESVAIRHREQRGTMLHALLNAAITGTAYGLIVLAAARGRLSIGDVALFAGATFQLSGALTRLTGYIGSLSRDRLLLRTFFDLLDRPPALAESSEASTGEREIGRGPSRETVHAKSTARLAPVIELRDVSFAYPDHPSPTLRNISLRIAPGEKLAIVGENGAGKTTLLNLISRLYDPTLGVILADGTPLRSLDVRAWRRRLVNVSQEFLRLEAPLRTNLALAALDHMDADASLCAACDQVGLADVVSRLPHGLDQMLGKRFHGGVELSGGEWQKIALARALLREEAGVLILDEPTSALDAPTEHAIFQQFVRMARERTTILISHRFSTVTMADRILLLEAGVIREEGTHSALLAQGGRYAELFDLQAARYR